MSVAVPFATTLNGKARRFLANPGRYLRLAPQLMLQGLSHCFVNASFFLQGQMDLNERSRWHNPEFVRQYGGHFLPGDSVARRVTNLDPWDSVRRDMLILLLRSINARGIPGEMAELGVYRGQTAKLIHQYMPDRPLHLFDTFTGFDDRDRTSEIEATGFKTLRGHFADTSVEAVMRYIERQNGHVLVYPGFFPETVPEALYNSRFAFVHLDADLYEPIKAGLEFFYPRMSSGGIIVVHDYNAWPGSRKAVDQFMVSRLEVPVPMPDKSGSVVITRT